MTHHTAWCFSIGDLALDCLVNTGPWFNIKMTSYQYRKSHCGDKTILRPSYLHNGISYTGKMSSLYWITPQIANHISQHTRQHTICGIYQRLVSFVSCVNTLSAQQNGHPKAISKNLVLIMTWRGISDEPLNEPMMAYYWRIYASFDLDELITVCFRHLSGCL